MLSERLRIKAAEALEYVWAEVHNDAEPDDILTGLITLHGAIHRPGNGTWYLRCGGISTSNTANCADQLVQGWRRNAVLQLSTL